MEVFNLLFEHRDLIGGTAALILVWQLKKEVRVGFDKLDDRLSDHETRIKKLEDHE